VQHTKRWVPLLAMALVAVSNGTLVAERQFVYQPVPRGQFTTVGVARANTLTGPERTAYRWNPPVVGLLADEAQPLPAPFATPEPTPPRRERATPAAQPAFASTGSSIEGTATWYAAWYMHTGDLVGAAGPLIRVGDWRGRIVQVCYESSCVNVRLVDWCACGDRGSLPTLIDLSPAAFSALAPQSIGVIRVRVSW